MTGTYVTRVYSLLGESSSSLRFLDKRTRILYGTFLHDTTPGLTSSLEEGYLMHCWKCRQKSENAVPRVLQSFFPLPNSDQHLIQTEYIDFLSICYQPQSLQSCAHRRLNIWASSTAYDFSSTKGCFVRCFRCHVKFKLVVTASAAYILYKMCYKFKLSNDDAR